VKYRDWTYELRLSKCEEVSVQNKRNIEASGGDEILYHITDGIAGAIGEEFFRSLVRHLAVALQVR
jgi:hypothetical protein